MLGATTLAMLAGAGMRAPQGAPAVAEPAGAARGTDERRIDFAKDVLPILA